MAGYVSLFHRNRSRVYYSACSRVDKVSRDSTIKLANISDCR